MTNNQGLKFLKIGSFIFNFSARKLYMFIVLHVPNITK